MARVQDERSTQTTARHPAPLHSQHTRDGVPMNGEQEDLDDLAQAINLARGRASLLRQQHRLEKAAGEELSRLLKEAANIVKAHRDDRRKRRTRRRRMWGRDCRCFWCGIVTTIKTVNLPNSATVEHIYPRSDPRRRDTRRHLPTFVLACSRCNGERGEKWASKPETCPVVIALQCAA